MCWKQICVGLQQNFIPLEIFKIVKKNQLSNKRARFVNCLISIIKLALPLYEMNIQIVNTPGVVSALVNDSLHVDSFEYSHLSDTEAIIL
jgi:hypothetical protein